MILTQLVETANKQLDELVKSQNGTASLGQLWKIWSDNQIATVMVSTLVGLVVIPVGLVVACSGLYRMRTPGDVHSYMIHKENSGWNAAGQVCHAETGNVYLRGNNRKPNANRTLRNGTDIEFIGYDSDYAHVRVSSTGQRGYITLRYTCGFDVP